MLSELRKNIENFSDELLIEQFTLHRDQYSDDALIIMKQVIKERKIPDDLLDTTKGSSTLGNAEITVFSKDDFLPLEHSFSQTDILLVQSILRDLKTPFYIETPTSSSILPLESEAAKVFKVYAHKDSIADVRNAISDHFDTQGVFYTIRYSDWKDRLKSINFNEIHLTEQEMEEQIEVSFNKEERDCIIAYSKKLMEEADAIERNTDRIIFYYDNLEDLIDKLSEQKVFTKADLLALLEVMQIYCDDAGCNQSMEKITEGLLGIFLNN